MGRPLNKRQFGPRTSDGNQIQVRFHDGSLPDVDGWIVKQRGSKRFRVTDGITTVDCVMVDKLGGDLLVGEMSINVKDDVGTATRITKIAAHKATSGGLPISWTFDDATDDSKSEMDEAGGGTDTVSVGDLIVGIAYEIVDKGSMIDAEWIAIGADADPIVGEVFVATGTDDGDGTVITAPDDWGL